MMTEKPATPDTDVSDHATGRSSADQSPRENDATQKHDTTHEAAQSPPPASSDKPAQAPLTAESADPSVDSDNVAAVPVKAAEELVADTPDAPPLPDEPLPEAQADDGWDCHWDAAHQAWFFHNRITDESTWENPRVPSQPQAPTKANTQLQTPPATAVPPMNERPPAGGYNPAIHGDYDPNAWYAKNGQEDDESEAPVMDPATAYATIGSFNRFTGRWQGDDQNPDRHNDESKSRRQMNAFFDVDAAANAHDGRSLKAERSGKKPTKSELKHFKEKRRAKKEERRRAWLRD
ncbi:hypothetical protein F4802DRAFT_341524 [Xylaria palmicola]|nr:hypothetical protein F4802DRAFT_341524 [Xylaria palmicola]